MTIKSDNIIQAIQTARTTDAHTIDIYHSHENSNQKYENEAVFFLKPEITKPSHNTQLGEIVDLALSKLNEFNVHISEIKLLGAAELKQKNIMASHYGVINRLASNAKKNLSASGKMTFQENFNISIDEADVLGGLEFLENHTEFNPSSLDILWQNAKSTKLAGGTYCAPIKVDANTVFIVNGFHPKQLEHFIEKNRSIVAFRVQSNTDWSILRNGLIGTTDPAKAERGSIRSELLFNKEKFGLNEVSQGSNGVHLSAGPVEGLAELCRFFNESKQDQGTLNKYILGKALISNFSTSAIEMILSDAKVSDNGKQTSMFEMTEEMNTSPAVEKIKNVQFLNI